MFSAKTDMRAWNYLSSWFTADIDSDDSRTSPVMESDSRTSEEKFCEQRVSAIADLPEHSQALIQELLLILSGEDEFHEQDNTFVERSPGYEKTAECRRREIDRVYKILSCSAPGVHSNMTSTCMPTKCAPMTLASNSLHVFACWVADGDTLLWMSTEYDHLHGPEMIVTLLDLGADPNAPNAVDGKRPLQSPWLNDDEMEGDDYSIACNARKRTALRSAGADDNLITCERRFDWATNGSNGTPMGSASGLFADGATRLRKRAQSALW